MEIEKKGWVWPTVKRTFWGMVILGLTAGNFRLWMEANELREENKKLAVEVEANKKVQHDEDALVAKIVQALKESK